MSDGGDFCYWSVADGPYARMFEVTVRSARTCGVREDFHVWSDSDVRGAVSHPAGPFDKRHFLFKLRFLKERVRELPHRYFVFLDADTYFVRHPGDVLRGLHGAPVHVPLESDCTRSRRPWLLSHTVTTFVSELTMKLRTILGPQYP